MTGEVVELEQVDVARGTGLGRVQDHQQVIRVGVQLGSVTAFGAVADRKRVEVERVGEHAPRLVIALGDVDPQESVPAHEQLGDLAGLALLGLAIRDPVDVHGGEPRDDCTSSATGAYNGTIRARGGHPCSTS